MVVPQVGWKSDEMQDGRGLKIQDLIRKMEDLTLDEILACASAPVKSAGTCKDVS